MRHLCLLILVVFLGSAVWAQTLSSPESIAIHQGTLYISNTGNGTIVKATMEEPGEPYEVFASGLGSVRGLAVTGDTLYAACNAGLAKYFIPSGEQLALITLSGAVFPNDVLVTDSYVFVSDNQGNKVYRHVRGTATASPFIISGLQAPNGMCWDWQQNRVLLVSYRSNSPVQTFDPESGVLSTVMQTTLDNCDGLAMDSNGALYISCWNPGAIHRLDVVGSEPAEFATGLSGPADFCLYERVLEPGADNWSEYELFCPQMSNSTVLSQNLPNLIVNSYAQCEYNMGGSLDSYESHFSWTTLSEMNLLGYEVWAANSPTEPYVQITPDIIPATNMSTLQHYTFSDELQHSFYQILTITVAGFTYIHGPFELEYIIVANSDPQQPELPVMRVYPNPVLNNTCLQLSMDKSAECELLLYDLRGRLLESRVLGTLSAGTHYLNADRLPLGSGLASGTYLLCLKSDKQRSFCRITLFR